MFLSALKPGDIIRIGRSPQTYAVVEAEVNVSHDGLRGDRYSVEEFAAVKLNDHGTFYTDERLEFIYEDYKVKWYHFTDGSMKGKGRAVEREKVKVVGRCKVNIEVKVTYLLSKPVMKEVK